MTAQVLLAFACGAATLAFVQACAIAIVLFVRDRREERQMTVAREHLWSVTAFDAAPPSVSTMPARIIVPSARQLRRAKRELRASVIARAS